jgi:hypothetical protein
VWGAASASAAINFTYEFDKSSNALAGGYQPPDSTVAGSPGADWTVS